MIKAEVPSEGDAYANEGARAKHEWGVQYQGSHESASDGTARAVRLHARALASTGLPVLLQSFTGRFLGPEGAVVGAEAMEESVRTETHELRFADIGELRLRIKHAVIRSAEELRSWIIPKFVLREENAALAMELGERLYSSTVVYSVWERSAIDPKIVSILKRVAECWVPCHQNAELLREHGIERVTIVPHPWEPTSPIAALAGRAPSPERRFYSIGLWQPRKGMHELLGAFLRAFRPTDSARLTLKYREMSWPDYPEPRASIEYWLSTARVQENGWKGERLGAHITLIDTHWPEEKIVQLHRSSNIYVSASHGEAWHLGAFDAKVAGNQLVHVPWGGTADFCDPTDVEIPFRLEPVPKSYGWEPDARWAAYDVDALTDALRRAVAPTEHMRSSAVERASFEKVGKLMRERVEVILGTNNTNNT